MYKEQFPTAKTVGNNSYDMLENEIYLRRPNFSIKAL